MSVHALFPTVPPFGTQSDQPLRVLGPDLTARITAVNAVRKALSAIGVIVESQDLSAGRKRPLLVLYRGDHRIRSLAHCVRAEGGVITATVYGVDVQWPERVTTPNPRAIASAIA